MTDPDFVREGFDGVSNLRYEEDESGRITLAKNRILVGCTGSVASIRLPRLLEELSSLKYHVNYLFQ